MCLHGNSLLKQMPYRVTRGNADAHQPEAVEPQIFSRISGAAVQLQFQHAPS